MIFAERTLEHGYTYECEDVFGKVLIESDERLPGDTLDGIVSILLKGPKGKEVSGSVATPQGTVSYTFTGAPQWEPDDEDDEQPNQETPCDDTHTSTSEPESESIATAPSKPGIFGWLRACAGALLAEWRKGRALQRELEEQRRSRNTHPGGEAPR